jgi:hypothetical protein
MIRINGSLFGRVQTALGLMIPLILTKMASFLGGMELDSDKDEDF